VNQPTGVALAHVALPPALLREGEDGVSAFLLHTGQRLAKVGNPAPASFPLLPPLRFLVSSPPGTTHARTPVE
jgi:hypothetical protein